MPGLAVTVARRAASIAILCLGLGSACGLSPGPARAMTLDGVGMPDSLQMQGQALHLNGMGLRSFTVLHIHGYIAGLYVPAPSHDPAALLAETGPKVLRIQFVRAAGIGRVQDEYQRGHRLNCVPACPPTEEAAFGQLLDTARSVRAGDTTSFVFLPKQLDVLFNDSRIASIASAEFSQHLLASFLGSQPPTVPFRNGLLGLTTR